MPKDQPSNKGFTPRSFSPYPSPSNCQDGWIESPRIRPPCSRTGLPSSQQSVNSIQPQLPSFRSSFGERSLIHSSPYAYTQPPPPRHLPISLDIDTIVTPLQYSSATRRMQYADSTVRGLPPPPASVAPGTSPSQRESLLYNPLYPHLPPLRPLRVPPKLDPVVAPTDPWERKRQSRAYPGITLERPSALAQPLAEAHIPPRLPPRSPDKPLLRNPQHQSSQVLDCAQPRHIVEAHESLPSDSSMDTARSSRSFLRNARNFRTGDWHVNNHNTMVVTSVSIDGWKVLQEHTAPNALHNSSARYDAPKCDEDTRVEVISELMEWIKNRAHPQRLLCMTGAAGAGKSALQQSIAECCAKDNILGGAYFISAADTSRNTASTIVPTIAYQLGLKHSILKRSIAAAVEHDPLIFSQSLETQMDALVVRPFESLRSRECDIATFPYAILIDGLDECQGELITTTDLRHGNTEAKCRAEDRQAELLAAIKNTLLEPDLPFRIFIASRPEWAIHTALGTGGSLHGLAYHIPLSDKYDATGDMCRYLRRRFQDIGLRINQPDWFTEGDIDTLVQAGSGQFVYVATVFKYVSERRASPPHRLKTVLDWTPGQETQPFEALDMLYTNILLSAKEAYEAVDTHRGRDFLFLLKIYLSDLKFSDHLEAEWEWNYVASNTGIDVVSALLNLESNALEILTLDLRSLVHFKENELGNRYLDVYHKSLLDFMDEADRAKDLFVPVSPICTHLAKCCMQRIIESPELELHPTIPVHWNDASFSKSCLPLAIYCLRNFLPGVDAIDDEIVDFTHKGGWHKIDMVLFKHSGFDIIFGGNWDDARSWAYRLGEAAENLEKRRPEAAEIMSKYVKKWEHFADKRYCERNGDPVSDRDSSSGSDDESSDSN